MNTGNEPVVRKPEGEVRVFAQRLQEMRLSPIVGKLRQAIHAGAGMEPALVG